MDSIKIGCLSPNHGFVKELKSLLEAHGVSEFLEVDSKSLAANLRNYMIALGDLTRGSKEQADHEQVT